MTQYRLAFIFDLDDTLVSTREIFVRAEETYLSRMEELGFDRNRVEEVFIEMERKNIQIFGFSTQRFPTSMGDTYAFLSNSIPDYRLDVGIKTELEGIGRQVYSITPELFDHAVKVLEILKKKGDRLLLWTKGDSVVQRNILTSNNLEHFFSSINIFDYKSVDELQYVLDENNLNIGNTWVIGDSMHSDINPALELGVNAIWIPGSGVSFEEAEPINQRFIQLSNISDILKVYPKLIELSSNTVK